MAGSTDRPRRRARPRPQLVTVSFALWLVWIAACVIATVLQFTTPTADLGALPAFLVALVVWGLVTWAAFRMAAGSSTARIVLVVIAVFRAVVSLTSGDLAIATIALSIAAAVLCFLPSVRPYFRRADA
ncbi:hypothetical protein [Curtobacterium sp. ISL-83]|uniref:hypothetical protein n=1 Tax=Curtobacterium sp. ISL-83 TaxID=2819145 RepID=UPI001BEC9B33|nr:hypothetical protein [Curtobacterium sp. ISL-83]MBT2502197.1 hypothetical protein [Curtobacterium sp. ISL-83]